MPNYNTLHAKTPNGTILVDYSAEGGPETKKYTKDWKRQVERAAKSGLILTIDSQNVEDVKDFVQAYEDSCRENGIMPLECFTTEDMVSKLICDLHSVDDSNSQLANPTKKQIQAAIKKAKG